MFEALSGIASAWREIVHVGELTGLSVGMVAGLAALAYFDPTLRKFAIRTAIVLILGYWAMLYAYHMGSADKQAEWKAANAAEAQREASRDKKAPQAADAETELKVLRDQINRDQEQINALHQADAVCRPISADELR